MYEKESKWLEVLDQLPSLLSLIDDMRALDRFREMSLGTSHDPRE